MLKPTPYLERYSGAIWQSMWSAHCPFLKSKTFWDCLFQPLPVQDVPRPHDGPCDPRRVAAPLHGRQGRAHYIFISYPHVHISAYFHMFKYQINLYVRMSTCHTFIYIKYNCMDDKVGHTTESQLHAFVEVKVCCWFFSILSVWLFHLHKVDGHGQMQTTVLPHVSRWDHSWLTILPVTVFPWSNRNNLKL